jgi:16S rRNA (cytosine967-C5)-methyltransferase
MLELFVEDHGHDEGLALAEAMNRRAPLAIRANTARGTREALALRLADEQVVARPTELAPAGLVCETRINAFALSAFRDGLFEVMDEGSQLVAELVAPPPGGRVVDACAGAGGKTLAIAAAMGGKGRLLALDVDGRKLEELRRRARRAGLSNVAARAVSDEAKLPDEARVGGWDRVLVDVPCSGLGTLRRNPEARWRLTPQAIAVFPARQLALLVTYAPLVAVGGRLIYATCTILEQENDKVVERFLAERPDFVRVPVKEIWGRELGEKAGDGLTLRLLPQTHDTDGFYAAVLRRKS